MLCELTVHLEMISKQNPTFWQDVAGASDTDEPKVKADTKIKKHC